MSLRKSSQLLSLGLLIYLIWLLSPMVDVAPTKNRTLNEELQIELKVESDAHVLREKAQHYLALNYQNRLRNSEAAYQACLILGGLLLIQIGTLAVEYRRTKNNGM